MSKVLVSSDILERIVSGFEKAICELDASYQYAAKNGLRPTVAQLNEITELRAVRKEARGVLQEITA